MRTKRQGLEIQVEEIFKQFYKDKIVKEKVNSFIISEDEIRGMLTTDPQENDGNFFSSELQHQIFWKFLKKEDKQVLVFVKLENFMGVE